MYYIRIIDDLLLLLWNPQRQIMNKLCQHVFVSGI